MLIICIKIFLTRILDVSLGTIRTILTVRNNKILASIIGFFEVLIWFIVAREALVEIDNYLVPIFYSLGFSFGTYIGTYLSNFINGNISVFVVTNNSKMIKIIKNNNYGITLINDKLLFIETNKKRYKKLLNIIKKYDSKAFIVVNDSKYVENGYFDIK